MTATKKTDQPEFAQHPENKVADSIVTTKASGPHVPQADAAAIAAGLPHRTDLSKVLEHDPIAPDDPKPVVLDAGDLEERQAYMKQLEKATKGEGPGGEGAAASLRSMKHNGIRTDAQTLALEEGHG